MSETNFLPPQDPVILGKIADPYSIRGWVHLHCFGDDPLAWGEVEQWYLQNPQGEWKQVALKGCKLHGSGVIALFEGISDRTAAEAVKGWLIALPKDQLPIPEEDEYYWAELVGMQVVNTAGELLGLVASLIETGANDVLQVRTADGEERLIPFVGAVVKTVDRSAQQITVDWGRDW